VQLAAERVEPAAHIVAAEHERRASVVDDQQTHVEAQQVRTPGLLERRDVERRAVGIPGQRVLHAVELVERVHIVDAVAQHALVDDAALIEVELRADVLLVDALEPVDPDLGELARCCAIHAPCVRAMPGIRPR
jgi:hypothetical protein